MHAGMALILALWERWSRNGAMYTCALGHVMKRRVVIVGSVGVCYVLMWVLNLGINWCFVQYVPTDRAASLMYPIKY